MSEVEPDISGFWTWFAANQTQIAEIMQGRRPGRVTELIDRALSANHLALTYEVTEGPMGAELTFTPEGDPVAAALIDRVVASAPTFSAWVIFGRVQRKSLQTALAFVKALHAVDLSDARFKSVYEGEVYHLCFLHDGLFLLDEDRRYAVASTFLDHALGEEISMDWIGGIEFLPAGEGVAMGLLINEIIAEVEGPTMARSIGSAPASNPTP